MLRTGQLTSGLRHVGFGIVDESGDPAQLAAVRPRVVRRSDHLKSRIEQHHAASRPTTEPRTTATELFKIAGTHSVNGPIKPRRTTRRPKPSESRLNVFGRAPASIADLEADLVRLNGQLEQTREILRQARKQTSRLQSAFNQVARNAAAIKKRRDTENQRLNQLDG